MSRGTIAALPRRYLWGMEALARCEHVLCISRHDRPRERNLSIENGMPVVTQTGTMERHGKKGSHSQVNQVCKSRI